MLMEEQFICIVVVWRVQRLVGYSSHSFDAGEEDDPFERFVDKEVVEVPERHERVAVSVAGVVGGTRVHVVGYVLFGKAELPFGLDDGVRDGVGDSIGDRGRVLGSGGDEALGDEVVHGGSVVTLPLPRRTEGVDLDHAVVVTVLVLVAAGLLVVQRGQQTGRERVHVHRVVVVR